MRFTETGTVREDEIDSHQDVYSIAMSKVHNSLKSFSVDEFHMELEDATEMAMYSWRVEGEVL